MELDNINDKVAIWYINLFVRVPSIVTCIPAMLYLHSLILVTLVGGRQDSKVRKDLMTICNKSSVSNCVPVVEILTKVRNGLAHCNLSAVSRYQALKSVLQAIGYDNFKEILEFIIGQYVNYISVEKLYYAIVGLQLHWDMSVDITDKYLDIIVGRLSEGTSQNFVDKMSHLENCLKGEQNHGKQK